MGTWDKVRIATPVGWEKDGPERNRISGPRLEWGVARCQWSEQGYEQKEKAGTGRETKRKKKKKKKKKESD